MRDRPATVRTLFRHLVPTAMPPAVLTGVTTTGFLVPAGTHLASLLVAVPALTAGLTSPYYTAVVAGLSCVAAAAIDIHDGLLWSPILPIHVIDLLVVCGLVIAFWRLRDLDGRRLAQVRSVSEAAQRAVLRPVPGRMGTVRLAAVYRSAAEHAEIGGDLYAAERVIGAVRVLIGDVRGKGLPAVDDAAAALGAFREAAHRNDTLPELVKSMEGSIRRHLSWVEETDRDGHEHFITALIVEIPDDTPEVRLIACGHPGPLRSHHGRTTLLGPKHPSPPLGLGGASDDYHVDTFPFYWGDTLLLHTDGLLEARDGAGTFYPAQDRVSALGWNDPGELVQRVLDDLMEHASGRLRDDVALVALERLRDPVPDPEH